VAQRSINNPPAVVPCMGPGTTTISTGSPGRTTATIERNARDSAWALLKGTNDQGDRRHGRLIS
jgi:hypothetical protein